MERRTALWLSHHWPESYDRCVHVGRSHVCRRCLWFWPVCLGTTVLTLVGIRWPIGLDPWLIALLPVPVVVEWWCEQLDLISYSARRQVVLTLLCAPAVGVGLARYLESPGDLVFWAIAGTYALVCLAGMFVARSRPDPVVTRWAQEPGPRGCAASRSDPAVGAPSRRDRPPRHR